MTLRKKNQTRTLKTTELANIKGGRPLFLPRPKPRDMQ